MSGQRQFVFLECSRRDLLDERQAAFTLLEMLLVLAILVAITAVTMPTVERMYDAHRLQQAAVEVRTALSAARLRAIDGGEAFECRIEPDGRHLVILPSRATRIRFGDDETGRSATKLARAPRHVELPEPLRFWTAASERERLPDVGGGDAEASRAWRRLTWSKPIVFAPSGSATNMEFEIRDPQGRAVRIGVRGLTGGASSTTLVERSDP